MTKPCLLLLAGGLAAQHSTLPATVGPVPTAVGCIFIACSRAGGGLSAMFLGGYALFMLAGGDIIGKRLHADYAGDSMLARVRVRRLSEGDRRFDRFDSWSRWRSSTAPACRGQLVRPPRVPAIGEVWELELRLQRPRGNSNPGVFDYESWLFREKIHATGYVVGGKRNRLLWSGTSIGS